MGARDLAEITQGLRAESDSNSRLQLQSIAPKCYSRHFPDGAVDTNLLANAGTQVQSLNQEDPKCLRAAKPVHQNC